jgi:hypothetical protein
VPHSVQPHISLPPGGGRPRNPPTTRGKHALHQVELDTMHQGVAPFATHQTVTHTAVANLRLYLSHDRSGLLPTVEAYRNQTYAMRMRFDARQAGVLKRGPWQGRVRAPAPFQSAARGIEPPGLLYGSGRSHSARQPLPREPQGQSLPATRSPPIPSL